MTEESIQGTWLEAKYDNDSRTLVVYIGSDAYECVDVPQDVWDSFKSASSKGKFFNNNIRGQYNHSMFS
jgi:hypothetical protein